MDIVNFLLLSCAKYEVNAEVYIVVVNFRHSSSSTEETYSRMLWDIAHPCRTLLYFRRLKSVFIDKLLPGTQTETRQFFCFNPQSDYHTLVRCTQALSGSLRVARWPASGACNRKK